MCEAQLCQDKQGTAHARSAKNLMTEEFIASIDNRLVRIEEKVLQIFAIIYSEKLKFQTKVE